MKLLTFTLPGSPQSPRLGALQGDLVIDLQEALAWAQEELSYPAGNISGSLLELVQAGPQAWSYSQNLLHIFAGADPLEASGARPARVRLSEVHLKPPLPRPPTLRDFNAFEQHVRAAFANRGRDVPAEWYTFPVFYYSNPNTIYGPGEDIPYPSYSQALDYELEVACIIGKPCKDVSPEEAAQVIFGYTIFNDWSARDVQRAEMKVGLGPAKGKDFASSIGPWIVTPDELDPWATGRPGVYDLGMTARINGVERSCGRWADLYYSFGEMIARASAGTWLYPGDVLGSGTVGTGCLLELTRGAGPWLQPGDTVELEIEGIGVLGNKVIK